MQWKWLDNNSLAEKEEYDHELEELQKVCSPFMAKFYGARQQQTGGATSSNGQGPTVEEVD